MKISLTYFKIGWYRAQNTLRLDYKYLGYQFVPYREIACVLRSI